MPSSNPKTLKVTLLKSLSGRKENHICCAKGLGLKKIRDSVEVANTPENRGMINKINYLLAVEE